MHSKAWSVMLALMPIHHNMNKNYIYTPALSLDFHILHGSPTAQARVFLGLNSAAWVYIWILLHTNHIQSRDQPLSTDHSWVWWHHTCTDALSSIENTEFKYYDLALEYFFILFYFNTRLGKVPIKGKSSQNIIYIAGVSK